jgi:hypothetical protein
MARPRKPKRTKPQPKGRGYTLSDVADALGDLTGEPIGADGALHAIEAGLIDSFVLPEELARGRLRFDPSICLWLLAVGEVALLAGHGTLTHPESEALLRRLTPSMPYAFQQLRRFKRKPAVTVVNATVQTKGRTEKTVQLNYLTKGFEIFASSRAERRRN